MVPLSVACFMMLNSSGVVGALPAPNVCNTTPEMGGWSTARIWKHQRHHDGWVGWQVYNDKIRTYFLTCILHITLVTNKLLLTVSMDMPGTILSTVTWWLISVCTLNRSISLCIKMASHWTKHFRKIINWRLTAFKIYFYAALYINRIQSYICSKYYTLIVRVLR